MTITNTRIDDASEEDAEMTTGESGSAVMSQTDNSTFRFADLSSDDEGAPSMRATSASSELEVWEAAREEGPDINPSAGVTDDTATDDNVRMYLREIGDVQLLSKADEAMLSQRVESANRFERIEWDIRGSLETEHGFKEYPRNRDQLPDNPPKVQASDVCCNRRIAPTQPACAYRRPDRFLHGEAEAGHFGASPYRLRVPNHDQRGAGYPSQGHEQAPAVRVVAAVPHRHTRGLREHRL